MVQSAKKGGGKEPKKEEGMGTKERVEEGDGKGRIVGRTGKIGDGDKERRWKGVKEQGGVKRMGRMKEGVARRVK